MMKSLSEFIRSAPLPGEVAQLLMCPSFRGLESSANYRDAAVTILLCPGGEQVFFPIIKRVIDGKSHQGQMALPGGRVDGDETFATAAIRELHEEIGSNQIDVEIIKELTPLKVPVSGYIVHPFIATYRGSSCKWSRQPSEVEKIYNVSLACLLSDAVVCNSRLAQFGMPANSPYFLLNDQIVWGATAMILSEFRQLLIG